MRITWAVQRVLVEFLRDPNGRHYGLEIAKGATIKSGTLYPVLARLEAEGWLTAEWEQIDASAERRPARRYYRLTPSGRLQAEEASARLRAAFRLLPDSPPC